MSSSPSNSAPQPASNERLDVPVLPPSSSRFVLPPPPSDLLNRLQAFLPQIKSANEQLEQEGTGVEGGEEAVVMEELSSDSDDSSDSSDSASEDDDEEDSDEDKEQEAEGGEQEMQEGGTLDRLLDINSRPKVIKKNLVVVETETENMEEK
ncbi:uncharacterized protein JCM6883_000627 [Sporobolomyces salmoneus]|uniref:uncharacterized protein n=1 Tax=Sporobolomyces salmoneus TaxID=183962 RepID=UPI003177217B